MADEVKFDTFIFYRSFYQVAQEMELEERTIFYNAIVEYALDGKNPNNLNGLAKAVFPIVKPILDSANKKRKAGKKGGSKKAPKENFIKFEDYPLVNLTQEQFDKLVEKYGKELTLLAINELDRWLGMGSKTATQYIDKNHYAHFKNDGWTIQNARKKLNEELGQTQPNWSV